MPLAVILLGLAVGLEPISITLQSNPEPVVGTLLSTTAQGMHVQRGESRSVVVVPWYELREQAPDAYKDVSLLAWKARTRLDRGDVSAALPLYISLSKDYLWKQGPQSMDVCDGLTACLIGSGRRRQAVEPMLSWFEAEGLPGAEGTPLPESMDEPMGLRRDLPPVFADGEAVQAADIPSDCDGRTRLIHAYYALVTDEQDSRAMRLAEIEDLKRQYRARDPGLIFLEQMCFAQAHPELSQRDAARDSLVRRAQTQRGTWIEVWCRLALGAGLVRDDDVRLRDRGVVELIHVIVRLAHIDPGLTLLAADLADQHLSSTNRSQWGSKLKQDARRNLVGADASRGVAGEAVQ